MSLVATAADTTHSELASIDWTAVIIASIAAGSATFAAWQSRLNAKAIRENSTMVAQNARLLQTNSGKTIGEHIEALQEGEIVLRAELMKIAQEKVADDARLAANKEKADAILAAASLEAIAKLAAAADVHIKETAQKTAHALISEAGKTAIELDQATP